MNKFWYGVQGYASCFGWILQAIAKWIWEECPDLKFWRLHEDWNDHLWYAERVNGRLAMLALTIVLILELVSGNSIWDFI
jgi:hypothetical protein